MKDIRKHIDNDKGMVLFSVLALIVAITAAAVVLVGMTTHELDVSANNKCQAQAFFSAESGMRGMMKVLDRSVEEAELVNPADLQFLAFNRDGNSADAKAHTRMFFSMTWRPMQMQPNLKSSPILK